MTSLRNRPTRLGWLLGRLQPGLMTRIAVALTAVGLIPLALAAVLLLRLNRTAMRDQVLQTHSVAARTAAERVGAELGALADLAEAVAGNPVLAGDPRSAAAQELLAGILGARGSVAAAVLLNDRGEEVLRAQRRGTAAVAAVLPREVGAAGVAAVAAEGAVWVLLERPLPGGLGRLRLLAEGAPLFAPLEAVEIGEEADLVVGTADGRVLAGSLGSLDAFPPALVEAGRNRTGFGASVFPGAGEEAGREVLGAWAPVPGSPWFVASRQPTRVAEAVERRMIREALLAVALALALAAVLSAGAYTSLVQPIRRVIRAQRRLAHRPEEPAGPRNEIEELRTSFAMIERRLKDQEELGRVFLGRYQVLDLLGEGAMGTVFRGWDPKLERPVALKTVRLGAEVLGSRRREVASRIRQEAVTAARVSHPNIVAVYDVEDTPEVAFFAMEFVEGVGLDHLLWRGPLDQGRVAIVGLTVARALAAVHRKGVVHRDVKPSNVLLGYDGAIKVTDFGIAEYVSQLTDGAETFFGTPGYVPPETIRGEGYDELGDLFSLGVLLYECLTGRQPFVRPSLRDTVVRTLKLEPEPVRQSRPEAAPSLADLVERLMQKDSRDRPATAGVVVEVLERTIADLRAVWITSDLKVDPPSAQPAARERSQLLPTVRSSLSGRL